MKIIEKKKAMIEVWEDYYYYQEEQELLQPWWYHPSIFSSSSSFTTTSAATTSHHHRFLHVNKFERSPRFGYSNNFADLFSSNQQVVTNYIFGLLVVSLLILCLFILWFTLLVIFKCCFFRRKFGFLSGSPFHQQIITIRSEENERQDDEEEDTKFFDEDDNVPPKGDKISSATTTNNGSNVNVVVQQKKKKKNPWISRGRIAFGTSCIFFFVFGIILSTVGIGNLNTTTTTIGDGATLGYLYFYDAQIHLNNAITTVDLLVEVKNQVVDELRRFIKAMKLARDVRDHHDHHQNGASGGSGGGMIHDDDDNNEMMMISIENSVEILLSSLDELGTFLSEPLKSIDSTLNNGQQVCHNIYTTTEQINFTNLQIGVGIVSTIFPVLLLGYLIKTTTIAMTTTEDNSNSNNNTNTNHNTNSNNDPTKQQQQQQSSRQQQQQQQQQCCLDYSSCFLNCVVLPFFVVLVIGCIVICCVISIVGLLNADFCSGGPYQTPDGTVMNILMEQGTDPMSFEFLGVDYVIHGCDVGSLATTQATTKTTPLHDVEDLERQLNVTLRELEATIVNVITTGTEMLLSSNNNETGYDPTALAETLQEFRGPLTDLFLIVGDFLQSMLCQPLYELYYTVVHQATCTDSYTGTFWIFVSLFMMSFFGLVAITFRAALYPPITTEPEEFDGWDIEEEEEEEKANVDETNGLVVVPNEAYDSGLSSVTMTDFRSSTSEVKHMKDDEKVQPIYSAVAGRGDSNLGVEEWSVDWTEKSNPSVKKYIVPEEETLVDKPSSAAETSANSNNLSSYWELRPVASNNYHQSEVSAILNDYDNSSCGVVPSAGGRNNGDNKNAPEEDGKNSGTAVSSSAMMSRVRRSLGNLRPNRHDDQTQADHDHNQIQIHDSWNSWISAEDLKHSIKSG